LSLEAPPAPSSFTPNPRRSHEIDGEDLQQLEQLSAGEDLVEDLQQFEQLARGEDLVEDLQQLEQRARDEDLVEDLGQLARPRRHRGDCSPPSTLVGTGRGVATGKRHLPSWATVWGGHFGGFWSRLSQQTPEASTSRPAVHGARFWFGTGCGAAPARTGTGSP
jgi:hypothetical protein